MVMQILNVIKIEATKAAKNFRPDQNFLYFTEKNHTDQKFLYFLEKQNNPIKISYTFPKKPTKFFTLSRTNQPLQYVSKNR